MIKRLIILFAISFYAIVYANPKPIGIELSKDTLQDVAKRYKIVKSEENAVEGYYNNDLDKKEIDIKALSRALVISNKNQVVEGVYLMLKKDQFNSVYEALSKKYKVITSQLPDIGDKYVKFQDEKCVIFIAAEHMSSDMMVGYSTEAFSRKSDERVERKERAKKEQVEKMF